MDDVQTAGRRQVRMPAQCAGGMQYQLAVVSHIISPAKMVCAAPGTAAPTRP